MVTVPDTAVETIEKSSRAPLLFELRAACSRCGITQQAIADRCKVTRPFVVNLFAGRSWSGEVVTTIQAMVAEAEQKPVKKKRGNGR